jgi:dipeptidyl-peptidase 4
MQAWKMAVALVLAGAGSSAVAEPPVELTLDRVFASPSLNGPSPRLPKLSPDGKWLTTLRPREDDRERFDLWAMDTLTSKSRMLVDSTKLGTSGDISEAEKMQRERARIGGTKGIVAYDWAADSQSIVVPVDGDLFLADLKGTVTRLTQTEAGELDATVSPKGGFVSFVRDQNLIVLDRATGSERALSKDGGGTLSWGVAEFVAQEEMDRARGHWWSPDDSRLAVARVDESDVLVVSRAAIGADGTKVFDQRYPKAGTSNARVDLYVMRSDGSSQVKIDLGKSPDVYLARVDWVPDGSSLIVQQESRDQKTLKVLLADANTGKTLPLFDETSKTWINLHDNVKVLKDDSILWTSERDGFSHLYRWKDGKWSQLTRGPWAIKQLVGVDEAQGRVWFTANKGNPVEQHLFSLSLNGGSPVQHTEGGWWHDVTMNKAATRTIVRRSSPTQPEQVYLGDPMGRRLAWIEENALDATHPYAPYLSSHVAPLFGTIEAADGTKLKTKLLLPRLDAGKRYPVFVQVYGGPGAGRQVTAGWSGALPQYLVDKGWIVFSVDGRGTPDRGKAFEDHIYRAMGTVEVADQLRGVEWLKTQPFVDPGKIVVYGWSYGGYMTLKLLEAAPGVFAAGVSGAPVTRWGLYDTHYTERYMGNPATDPKPYEASDVVPHIDAIADPLLVIHGMADDNVVFEHTTALLAAMQAKAKPFETMVYPGQTHRVAGEGVSVHLWQTILDFLNRNVKNKD